MPGKSSVLSGEAGSRSCLDAGGPEDAVTNRAGGWVAPERGGFCVRGLHGLSRFLVPGSVSQATSSLGQGPPVVCGKTAIEKKKNTSNLIGINKGEFLALLPN